MKRSLIPMLLDGVEISLILDCLNVSFHRIEGELKSPLLGNVSKSNLIKVQNQIKALISRFQ